MEKIVRITDLTRMRSSVNGNPRWKVCLSDGTSYPTAVDASCAYGINNSELKGLVKIEVERGQISYISPVS